MTKNTDTKTDDAQNTKISDDDIIADIRRVAEEVGGAPTTTEYREHGDYNLSTPINRFDTWNGALRIAGFEPQHEHRTRDRDELIADLRAAAEEYGENLSFTDFREYANEHDIARPETYTTRFGTWNAAKEAAGLPTRPPQRASDEDALIEDIKRVADTVGGEPTTDDYDEHGDYSVGTMINTFGSWIDAKDAAGVIDDMEAAERKRRGVTREDIIADLERVADNLDGDVTLRDYREHGRHAPATIVEKFDSWNAAKEAAGLETYPGEVMREEIIADIRRVAADLGEMPSASAYNEHGQFYTSTVTNHFDSWNAAKEAARAANDDSDGAGA